MNEMATVLVVDSESTSLELLVNTLSAAGYDVRSAGNCELAIEVAAGRSDLIVLDVRATGVGVLEVCRRLKSREETRRIPIILTGLPGDTEAWVAGLELGASDWLAKPIHPSLLLSCVRTHLALARAQVALEQSNARVALHERQHVAMVELGELALSGPTLPVLMDRAVRLIADALDVELCKVLELLPDRSAFLLRAGVGWREGLVGHATVGIDLDSEAGFTLLSKQPVIVEDLRTETRFSGPPLLREHGVVSGMSVLIGDPGRAYGVLGAHTTRHRTFSAEEVDVLRGVSELLARAVQHKAHVREIERLSRQQATLSQVNQAIVRCETRQALFDDICRVMLEVSRFSGAWIGWTGSPGKPLVPLAHRMSGRAPSLAIPGWRAGCEVVDEALRAGAPSLSNDAQADPRTAGCHETVAAMQLGSCAAFPLRCGGHVCGVLRIYAAGKGFFTADEATLLDEVAANISFALDWLDKKEQRKRLLAALEQAGEAIVLTDPQGTIEYVNPAFERATGYARDEVLGRNPSLLKSGEHDDAFYQDLWTTITAGRPWRSRMVNKRKDGELFTEDATISPVFDASGRIVNFVAVKRDITAQLHLEEQLRVSQKMEAIGSLTGGIAHDFNNLLSVIINYTSFALERVGEEDPLRGELLPIKQAADRAADLTRQLLAFSRKQLLEPQVLHLNQVVTSLESMLRRLVSESIDIQWTLAPDLGLVKADPGQLEQVIMNLVVNALDAMPGGGALTFETANVELDQNYAAQHVDVTPGRYVLLAVSDSGCGMDAATRQRVFEPFFTTKPKGKGTGLGLATVYGIVKQSGGNVEVYSEPWQGTTFKVYLPRVAATDRPGRASRMPSRPSIGSEVVLVVEDDPQVCEVAARLLRAAGYHVLTAANGDEAIAACEQYSEPINLLLTDVVLPRMSGRQLVEQLQALRPGIRVLYMSGYTDEAIVHHGVLESGMRFISKPFSGAELARKVRDVLDEPVDPPGSGSP